MYVGKILKDYLRIISATGRVFQNYVDFNNFTTLAEIGSYHLLGGGS